MDRALKMVYYDDADVEHDIFAQLNLALKNFRGIGMPRDESATRRILDQIHRQSRAFAAVCYGFMRSKGIGVSRDSGEGQQWYREAAYWFREEAESGAGTSANNLGYLYAKGLGVPENPDMAADWFRDAADRGSPVAIYNLGVCYLNGWGVEQDDSKAVELLQSACDHNDVTAASVLAYLYLEGRGVKRDPGKSFEYNLRAARAGSIEAASALGYAFGVGLGAERNIEASISWFELAAGEGDAYAQANLAMYFCHSSELKLFNRGWQMLSFACDQGDVSAKYQMTQILIFGVNHREPDYSKALDLAMDLAELGHPGGYHLIGVMYEHGLGVPVDMKRAAGWYERAARKGSANGQSALGRLYAIGNGVRQDNVQAYYWLKLAAPAQNTLAYRELDAVRARMTVEEIHRADKLFISDPAPRRSHVGLRTIE
ncbi:SEL1-like repeat protein [Thalassospira sp. NFXS8]|uniref:SEL1-like repeat protein n=1 Tax=Thalassospira sp. NFXS8 TaxID=2819093 RepID=UPI0032DF9830